VFHARHEVHADSDIGKQPRGQGQHQPPVGLREQIQRGTGIDHDVPQRIHHLHSRFTQRGAGLHHPVGNAAGKVVLEEAQALPHHVVVHQPARTVAQARHDGLVDQQVVQCHKQRPRQQGNAGHPQQLTGMALEEARPGTVGQHVDDAAEEVEHRHFHQCQQQAGDQRCQQHRPYRSQVMQVETHHATRWRAGIDRRKNGNQGREPAQHRHDL